MTPKTGNDILRGASATKAANGPPIPYAPDIGYHALAVNCSYEAFNRIVAYVKRQSDVSLISRVDSHKPIKIRADQSRLSNAKG